MQRDARAAVDDAAKVDARLGIAEPETRIAKYRCHAGENREVLFIDETQLVSIERIVAQSYPQRIQNDVARAELLLDFRERLR